MAVKNYRPETLAVQAGVAVSPFKQLESELLCQYYKLDKKIPTLRQPRAVFLFIEQVHLFLKTQNMRQTCLH